MNKIIGLGEYATSDKIEDVIKTYALGSCVGLVVYNTREKKLGMAHIVLPDSQNKDGDMQKNKEAYYADIAVPLLFQKMFGGYPGEDIFYRVSLYGGAKSKNKEDVFCIGERNLKKIEELLQKNNIYYSRKDTGGHFSRTIEAYVNDGRVKVHKREQPF